MPFVFVHGVNVRRSASNTMSAEVRNGLFRRYALTAISTDPSRVAIENPYWGQFGALPAWNGGSLPGGKYEDFGETTSIYEEILDEMASDIQAATADAILLTLGHKSLERAVDCLWTAAAVRSSDTTLATALADLSTIALKYARDNPHPEWLGQVRDDNGFIERFLTELHGWNDDSSSLAMTHNARCTKLSNIGTSCG